MSKKKNYFSNSSILFSIYFASKLYLFNTSISYLFSNCNLLEHYGQLTFGNIEDQNNTLQYLEATFKDFKIINNGEEVPINLSPTFFKNLNKIIDVGYLFQNCYFSSAIPFNLFNKRKIDTTIDRNVYVKVLDEYKPTTLTIYTYSKDIEWYVGLFQGCKWTVLQYDPSQYNIPRNRVELGDYDVYYTKNQNGEYIEHQLEQNTEITDAENLQGYYVQSYGNNQYNFTLQGDSNKLIIPPDLFYGTASKTQFGQIRKVVSLDSALNCKIALQGIIPKHLLKNCMTASISNLFANQDVIPQFIDSYQDNGKTINIYSQFPLNYTNYTVLDYAFACNPVIPINTTTTTNWVFMIMQSTINKQVSSMAYAFTIPYLQYWGQSKPDNNYINYIGHVENNLISIGLNMNYFSNLTLDNIFNSWLNNIIQDNLFNSSFDAKNINMKNSSTYVFTRTRNDNSSMSQNIKFPLATGQIRQLINPNGVSIKASQIISSSSSKQYYIDAGITIIE